MVRFKNRYFLCELIWKDKKVDEQLTGLTIFRALKDCVQYNFGDYGLGSLQQSMHVKYYNPLTSLCIVRCSRDNYQMAWSALTMLTHIGKRPVMVRTLHLGGTIRSCQAEAIKHNRDALIVLQANARDQAHRKQAQQMLESDAENKQIRSLGT